MPKAPPDAKIASTQVAINTAPQRMYGLSSWVPTTAILINADSE
jgi:hypothetical protein